MRISAKTTGMLNGTAGIAIAEVTLNTLGVQEHRSLFGAVLAVLASGVLMSTVMKDTVKKMSESDADDFSTYSFSTPVAVYVTASFAKK